MAPLASGKYPEEHDCIPQIKAWYSMFASDNCSAEAKAFPIFRRNPTPQPDGASEREVYAGGKIGSIRVAYIALYIRCDIFSIPVQYDQYSDCSSIGPAESAASFNASPTDLCPQQARHTICTALLLQRLQAVQAVHRVDCSLEMKQGPD